MTVADLRQYRHGGIAGEFGKSEETLPIAKKALESLATDLNIQANIRPYVNGAFASPQGIATASKGAGEEYERIRGGIDVNTLYTDVYAQDLATFLPGNVGQRFANFFQQYAGDTWETLRKRYEEAEYILKDEHGLFPQARKDQATQTVDGLKKLMNTMKLLESTNIERWSRPLMDEAQAEGIDEFSKTL